MTQDILSAHQTQNEIDERSTVTDTDTDSSATDASDYERQQPRRKGVKRTAPTGGAEQGDAKRKDFKRNSEASVADKISFPEPGTASSTALAANAAAILSTVPNTTQVGNNDATRQVLANQQQFATVLSAATTLNQINSNSPIAVAPVLNGQANIVSNGSTGLPPNVEDFLNHQAVAAAAAQAQAEQTAQEQSQMTGNSKRNTNLRNMSNDERRQRRLLRNRVAAKECRRKKKAYVADLEEKVTRLEEDNQRLHKELEEMNAKLTLGALRIEENNRLIKEVEELNAKLALRAVVQQVQSADPSIIEKQLNLSLSKNQSVNTHT